MLPAVNYSRWNTSKCYCAVVCVVIPSYSNFLTCYFRYVTTEFMAPAVMEHSRRKGVKFADPADAANAILKIQSDPSINGMINAYMVQLPKCLHCNRSIFYNHTSG